MQHQATLYLYQRGKRRAFDVTYTIWGGEPPSFDSPGEPLEIEVLEALDERGRDYIGPALEYPDILDERIASLTTAIKELHGIPA